VAEKYDGSLKRAWQRQEYVPLVERDGAQEAFGIMREIKKIFEPTSSLNPE